MLPRLFERVQYAQDRRDQHKQKQQYLNQLIYVMAFAYGELMHHVQ